MTLSETNVRATVPIVKQVFTGRVHRNRREEKGPGISVSWPESLQYCTKSVPKPMIDGPFSTSVQRFQSYNGKNRKRHRIRELL